MDNKRSYISRLYYEKLLEEGKITQRAPLGYKNACIEGKTTMIIDEHYASLIKKAFELYSTGAYSLEKVAQECQKKYGIYITKKQIEKVLSNPTYYGYFKTKKGLIKHIYPTLVSEELFNCVQKIKSGFKRRSNSSFVPILYRGIIHCGICNRSIVGENHKGHTYYRCVTDKNHGNSYTREEVITQQLKPFYELFSLSDKLQSYQHRLRPFFSLIFNEVKLIGKTLSYTLKEGIDGKIIARLLHEQEQTSILLPSPLSNNPLLNFCSIPRTIDEISNFLQKDIHVLQSELFDLSLEGLIEQDLRGKWKTL